MDVERRRYNNEGKCTVGYFVSKSGFKATALEQEKERSSFKSDQEGSLVLLGTKDIIRELDQKVLNYKNQYDGIWACASLLHIKRDKLEEVIIKCMNALKDNGILYCSFKYGDMEVEKDNRYFNFINEEIIKNISKRCNIEIIEMYKSTDVRKDRNNEEWINMIFKLL